MKKFRKFAYLKSACEEKLNGLKKPCYRFKLITSLQRHFRTKSYAKSTQKGESHLVQENIGSKFSLLASA